MTPPTMQRLPPDLEARAYGPQRIAAVVAALAEVGVAPELTLAGSGIGPAALDIAETRVSYRQVEKVFRNALRLTPDAAVAFRAGARMHLTAYGIYGYGLMSSPTHAAQVEFAIKYGGLMGPVAGAVAFSRDGDLGAYTYDVFLTPDPGDELYRFALEFAFSAHLALSRDLQGPEFGFVAVHACCPAPAHAAMYPMLFGCPVQFGHQNNEVLVGAHWLELPHARPCHAQHGARALPAACR
jgi:hypothetical protein